jgi:hypothetical protein
MQFSVKVVEGSVVNTTDLLSYLVINREQTTIHLQLEDAPALECVRMGDIGFLNFLEKFCVEHSLRKESISLLTENMIQDKGVWPNIKIVPGVYPFEYGKNVSYSGIKDIKKKFGIFIGRATWHRLYLSTILFNRYRDDSLISFWQHLKDPRQPANLRIDELLSNMARFCKRELLEQITNFVNHLPMHLCEEDRLNNNNRGWINYDRAYDFIHRYDEIFLDVVCETMHQGRTFYLTEKMARPLLTGTPFVVFGPQNYLQNLRRLGFKTFNDVWDEEYDNHEGASRLHHMEKLLDRISQFSVAEMNTILNNTKDILEHNKRVYADLTLLKINRTYLQ